MADRRRQPPCRFAPSGLDNVFAAPAIQCGMRHLAAAFLLAHAVTLQASSTSGQSSPAINDTWIIELHQGQAFVQLHTVPPPDWNGNGRGDWNTGQSVAIDELNGLPPGDDHFTASDITLDLRREAGTLAFQGSFRDGRGAGLFTFTPRPAFDAEMMALGYRESLPLWRRFQLAVHDVGPKYVRGMKAEGYGALTLDELQRARTHGGDRGARESDEGGRLPAVHDRRDRAAARSRRDPRVREPRARPRLQGRDGRGAHLSEELRPPEGLTRDFTAPAPGARASAHDGCAAVAVVSLRFRLSVGPSMWRGSSVGRAYD